MADLEERSRRYKGVIICTCSFFINALALGIIFNFGVMLPTFLDEFNAGRTITALVGSCQYSLMLVLGPLAGSLIDRYGLRTVSIAGGFLFSVGLTSASYTNTIYGLFPTFSFIFSTASCLLYSSFQISPLRCISTEYQGLASALVSCGCPIGILSFSLIITFLLEQFHWKIMFRILAYLGVIICILSLTYGWLEERQESSKKTELINVPEKKRKSFCNTSFCKRPLFLVLVFGSAVGMLGWPVGNFFLADRAKAYGIHENKSKWFYFVIGASSILGSFIAGKIADTIKRRTLVTTVFFFLHGINTLFSYLCQTYTTMFIYSIFSGLFIGFYNSIICLAMMDCVGTANIAQAFGFMNLVQGFSISLGPPIAGLLRDSTGSYKLPLILAGCSEILGALISLPSATIQKGQQECRSDCENNTVV